ncbi:MAG: hypothetical protein HOW97_08730 [Catenulispora sp.]|nr:hypothetical protein [Catenulispora sp.]
MKVTRKVKALAVIATTGTAIALGAPSAFANGIGGDTSQGGCHAWFIQDPYLGWNWARGHIDNTNCRMRVEQENLNTGGHAYTDWIDTTGAVSADSQALYHHDGVHQLRLWVLDKYNSNIPVVGDWIS